MSVKLCRRNCFLRLMRVPRLGRSASKKFQGLERFSPLSSKPWKSSAAGRRGFTLIEVLLAMLILGLSVTALLAAVSQALGVARRARIYDQARGLIERVELENPLALEEDLFEGTTSGSFGGGPDGYSWERTVELVDTGGVNTIFDDPVGLFKITTRVIWGQRGRDGFEEVATYIYRPDLLEY